jgi:DNA polymerase-1
MEGVKRYARRYGTVYTYFGRPRRIKQYFNTGDRRDIGFAYRTSVNTLVQGAAADILRIALVRLWDNIFQSQKYKEKIKFVSTVHDEVNLIVHKSLFPEILYDLKEVFEFHIEGWQIQMKADFEIGTSWGHAFPFKIERGEKPVPEFEEAT